MPSSQSHLLSEIPASEQGFLSLMQLNGRPFIFLIPILVAVVDLAIQGAATTLLETHATNLYAFILSTTIYAFAVTANLGLVAFISGFLSSVSMVSMVVPSWFWYILFISWALVSVFVTYLHFKEMFNTLIMKMGHKIRHIGGWLSDGPGLPAVNQNLGQSGQVVNHVCRGNLHDV